MTLYLFHLAGPGGFSQDEEGAEFPTLEAAYLSCWQAAVEMSVEAIRANRDASRERFEICDGDGRFLLELPFSEVMRPGARAALPTVELRERLHDGLRRGRELKNELNTGLQQARDSLELAQSTLRGS